MFNTLKNKKVNKSVKPTMLIYTFGLFALLNYYFHDRYLQIIEMQTSYSIEAVIAYVVVLWIIFTSFFACFHLMSFMFSLYVRNSKKKIIRNYNTKPPVAIFYTCMNDMKEKSISSCLNQDYPNFNLFILDDSTTINEIKRVDAIKTKYGERITIIRRQDRQGFKAGNMNNALQEIGDSYKYVSVIDADELIPSSFLREMVSIAEGNEEIGFVQASHQQYSVNKYGKKTGDGIDLHWNFFLPARNCFGFVYFYGHGALLRYEAIKSVGGIPEIVSEDLALATRLREIGYRGYYAHDIKCLEESPSSYNAFRRRNRKITSGTLEFLSKYYPSFFRSKRVTFVEKVDLLVSCSLIYLPIPFICYIILLHSIILLSGIVVSIESFTQYSNINSIYNQTTMEMFKPLWAFDSVTFIFFTVFAQICYLIPNAIKSPQKVVLYLARMSSIYLSDSIQVFGTVINWFFTKRTFFIPTGDRTHKTTNSFYLYIECLIGITMLTISLLVGSLCLFAVGLSIAIIPFLIKKNLEGRVLSKIIYLPMLLTIIALCVFPLSAVGAIGIISGISLAHH